MRRVAAMGKGGVHAGSIYLTSTVGVAARCNLELLDSVAHSLSGLVGPFIVCGDWNCTPDDLRATGWLKKIGGIIHAPTADTCNGDVYDFFVASA